MYVVSASSPGDAELEANFGMHVWSPQTGTVLASFKHANVTLHGLSMLGRDHLVATQAHRAGIHIWDWRKEVPQIRCTPPERVGAIATSPSGVYCAAAGATSGKVYLWQVSNGRLLRTWDAHYRAVTSLCFSDDSVFIYTAGEDALVKCWTLAELIAVRLTSQSSLGDDQDAKPVHTYTGHTLPVTALKVGRGGYTARIFSASLDRTVKVYEMTGSRELVASMAFPSAVHAVATDPSERSIFAGLADGSIHRAVLAPTARVGPSQNPSADAPSSSLIFYGHKLSVTALAVSPDESFLISGSADGTCKVWHISSAQMLVNFDKHKGEVVDLKVFLSPSQCNFALADADELTTETSAFALPIAPFQKYSEASSITPSRSSSSAGYEASLSRQNIAPVEFTDGDVVVNLYSNKRDPMGSRKKKEIEDDTERLRAQYWKALPSSSKGEEDTALIQKAMKYWKTEKTIEKPKELELSEQVARLQAELEAAKEQNNKWQEINNQMYRQMFSVLMKDQSSAAPKPNGPAL